MNKRRGFISFRTNDQYEFIQQDDGSVAIVNSDNGTVPQENKWLFLKEKIDKFYSTGKDEEVAEHNKKMLSEHEVECELQKANREKRPGYIYLVRAKEVRSYKIGQSENPSDRITSMQTGSPVRLSLVHYFKTDDMDSAEEFMHMTYGEYRLNGEWFALPSDAVVEIMDIGDFGIDNLVLEIWK